LETRINVWQLEKDFPLCPYSDEGVTAKRVTALSLQLKIA